MTTSKPLDPLSSSTKYRFICYTCGKRGKWTPDFEKAKAETIVHREEEPDHDVDIDIDNSIHT